MVESHQISDTESKIAAISSLHGWQQMAHFGQGRAIILADTVFNRDPGIIFSPTSRLESPEPESPEPESVKDFEQESTLQLPFGHHSILSALLDGNISPIQAMVVLCLCYRSNWATGNTWRTS